MDTTGTARTTPIPVRKVQSIPVTRVPRDRSIHVCWTSGVTQGEGLSTEQGVRDVLAIAGLDRRVVVLGGIAGSEGDYALLDWYQIQSLFPQPQEHGFGPQISAERLFNLVRDKTWQKGESTLNVMVVDHDLHSEVPGLNYILGIAKPEFALVQSVIRFRSVQDPWRYRLIRRLAAHEFGHVLGLPGGNSTVSANLSPHCPNICVMRDVGDFDSAIRQMTEEDRNGIPFCEACVAQLRKLTH